MIPHSSMAIPQTSLSHAASSRGSIRPFSHPDALPADLRSQRVFIDLTDNDAGDSNGERPVKRQRLDYGAGLSSPSRVPAAVGGEPSVNPLDLRRSLPGDAGRTPSPWPLQGRPSKLGTDVSSVDGDFEGEAWQRPFVPPLPIRPWKCRPPAKSRRGAASSTQILESKVVETTPYSMTPGPKAPAYDGQGPADYYPWTGSHPEDNLTPQAVKQGFYDSGSATHNESNTARQSVFPQLKHRAGLAALSSIFSAALEKRQARSQVTAPSTFRPPPRVTLTDNKREAWLRDLANPSVPLRRLSRTIPHGIRGKVLLDQCLGKSIPIGRAIWLARCVGANEIRAFKRKGTSAAVATGLEVKYIKDWTASVEQFLEGVAATAGDVNWGPKMSYAMRLSAGLLLENLLDQDHIVDWFLASFESATLDTCPLWLSMIGVFWQHLLQYRKRGKRLAECVLEKLQLIYLNAQYSPLSARLSHLLRALVQTRPGSFILPHTWDKYHSVLSSCLGSGNPWEQMSFSQLSCRNDLVRKAKNAPGTVPRSPSQHLVHLLDAFTGDVSALFSNCMLLSLNHETLIGTIMEWASTAFRHGLFRKYIAVRLLRRWKRFGIDIDTHIFTFLLRNQHKKCLRDTDVYHIVSELVRSRSFSVGRYLQWLMARGAVGSSEQAGALRDVGLLFHIPSARLPSHIWNLRNTLVNRTGFQPARETHTVQQVKEVLRHRLPDLFSDSNTKEDSEMTDDFDLAGLTWTVRSEIGHWIRDSVASHVKNCLKSAMDNDFACDIKTSALTAEEFYEVRRVLESVEDLSMLADVLKYASGSDDVIVLASAADTLNYNLDSFNAIGATDDLFKSFTEAYSRITKTEPLSHELITSLLDVALKVPDGISTVAILRRDMSQLDRKFAMAASSPVSDIQDTLNTAKPTFTEELNQLLSPGNTMDEPTLSRIFETLTERLSSDTDDAKLSPNQAGRYLAQLRTFNPKYFDSHLVKWISSLLRMAPRPHLSVILPPLIGVGCVALQPFFTLVKGQLSASSQDTAVPNPLSLRIDVLRLLCPKSPADTGSLDLVSYRFKIARQEYFAQCPNDILAFIQDTMACAAASPGSHEPVTQPTEAVLPLLRRLIVQHPNLVAGHSAEQLEEKYSASVNVIHKALGVLLGSEHKEGSSIHQTIQLIDNFSLPFCLVKLQLQFSELSNPEAKTEVFDLLFNAAESNIRSGSSHWVDVVRILPPEAAQHIRQTAEEQLLAIALKLLASELVYDNQSEIDTEVTSLVYLRIVEDLAYSIPERIISTFGTQLVEKMNSLLQRVISTTSSTRNADTPSEAATSRAILPQERIRNFSFWFYVLLRLAALHRSTFAITSAITKSDVVDQIRLLLAICCIAFSPLFSDPQTPQYAFPTSVPLPPSNFNLGTSPSSTTLHTQALDVASTLVDTLSNDVRQQCARFLRDRCPPYLHPQNNPYLLFIFGPLADAALLPSSTQAPPNAAPAPVSASGVPTRMQYPSFPSPSHLAPPAPHDSNITHSAHKFRFQQAGRVVAPYIPRAWEMLEESAPMVGVNDTALNLRYFGARRTRG